MEEAVDHIRQTGTEADFRYKDRNVLDADQSHPDAGADVDCIGPDGKLDGCTDSAEIDHSLAESETVFDCTVGTGRRQESCTEIHHHTDCLSCTD